MKLILLVALLVLSCTGRPPQQQRMEEPAEPQQDMSDDFQQEEGSVD